MLNQIITNMPLRCNSDAFRYNVDPTSIQLRYNLDAVRRVQLSLAAYCPLASKVFGLCSVKICLKLELADSLVFSRLSCTCFPLLSVRRVQQASMRVKLNVALTLVLLFQSVKAICSSLLRIQTLRIIRYVA